MPPLVIPVFIAHQGCPHRCIFCDQDTITGESAAGRLPTGAVAETITRWLARPRRFAGGPVQVAFYGGSFTGLPQDRQEELLAAVQPFMARGEVQTIRLSTRPDYVDTQTPDFLQARGVGIVELGVQSLVAEVLHASGRGHSVGQSTRAFEILKGAGLQVGIQLMLGLPGDTTAGLVRTVRQVARLKPDFVRLYPCLVIKDSGLAGLYAQGKYRPLSLNRAVALTARAKDIFDRQGIKTVRMGLQPSEELQDKVLAGPYHPAFGELVISRQFFRQTRKLLTRVTADDRLRLVIAAADESAFRGAGNANMKRLTALGLQDRFELVFDPGQPRYTIKAKG